MVNNLFTSRFQTVTTLTVKVELLWPRLQSPNSVTSESKWILYIGTQVQPSNNEDRGLVTRVRPHSGQFWLKEKGGD